MFQKILVEKNILHHPNTKKILNNLKDPHIEIIESYEDYWGKVKKPYLQKRDNLFLFLAKKKGQLIKKTPDAYGTDGDNHFYFIHAYNCIYECEYCYLQGYFHTPDLVLFVNHDEIINEMARISKNYPSVWFHAGEFSDSLALSHITDEFDIYWDFFKKNKNAKLELRTKSVNIKNIMNKEPLENIITTFSLSSSQSSKEHDLKTPSTNARLKALKKLSDKGFQLGIHFDPIIYQENLEKNYDKLISDLLEKVNIDLINYFSIGVVRFTENVYKEVKKNYPSSKIHLGPYTKSFDEKIRYSRPTREWMLSKIKDLLIKNGIENKKIYLCME